MERYPCITYSDFMDSVLNLENECALIGVQRPKRLIYVRDRHTLLQTISCTDAYAVAHKFSDADNELYDLVSIPVKNATSQICFGYVFRKNASNGKKYIKKYREMLIEILGEAIDRYFK